MSSLIQASSNQVHPDVYKIARGIVEPLQRCSPDSYFASTKKNKIRLAFLRLLAAQILRHKHSPTLPEKQRSQLVLFHRDRSGDTETKRDNLLSVLQDILCLPVAATKPLTQAESRLIELLEQEGIKFSTGASNEDCTVPSKSASYKIGDTILELGYAYNLVSPKRARLAVYASNPELFLQCARDSRDLSEGSLEKKKAVLEKFNGISFLGSIRSRDTNASTDFSSCKRYTDQDLKLKSLIVELV